MTVSRRFHHHFVVLAVVPFLIGTLAMAAPFSVVSQAAGTNRVSYVSFDNNGSAAGTDQSPCDATGSCANGVSFSWSKGTCYDDDRYPPVVIVFTVNHKVPANTWPLVAPCSTGLQISWNSKNTLTGAMWLGAQDPPTSDGLAVCWHRHQCNAIHCVTAGCLPQHTNGVDIFFQGGESIQSAQWLNQNGVARSVSLPSAANDVFWYGSTPPSTPFSSSDASKGATHATTTLPTVDLVGRASHHARITTKAAPSDASGVDFSWYLPLDQSGPDRGCFNAGGQSWSAFPNAFEYTTNGVLNSRVTVPTCPVDATGALMPFNDVHFSWSPAANGSGDVLTAATPRYDWSSKIGCQNGLTSNRPMPTSPFPSTTLPQPPPDTNGVVVSFHRDDFKSSCWTGRGQVLAPALSAPGHSRLGQWQG